MRPDEIFSIIVLGSSDGALFSVNRQDDGDNTQLSCAGLGLTSLLRILHALACFLSATKRHRVQETMITVFRSLKWGHRTQWRLIFGFLYPIAVFHHD